jgi:hypothetical protein
VSAPVAKDAKSTSSAEQAKTEVGKQPTQQQSQLIQAKPTQTIVQHPQLISNQQVANAIPATPRKIQQPIQSVEKNSSCMISVALVEFMSERDKEKRKDFIERDTHQSKTCGNEA